MFASKRCFRMMRRLNESTLTKSIHTDHSNNKLGLSETENQKESSRENDKWVFRKRDNINFDWRYLIPGYSFYSARKCLHADKNYTFFRWLGLSLFAQLPMLIPYSLILLSLCAYLRIVGFREGISPFWVMLMGIIVYPLFSGLPKNNIEADYHGKNPFYLP